MSDEALVKGDGESWEAYAVRLERRIRDQRDHISELVRLRKVPGDRQARHRIATLERLLGKKEVALMLSREAVRALKRCAVAGRELSFMRDALVQVKSHLENFDGDYENGDLLARVLRMLPENGGSVRVLDRAEAAPQGVFVGVVDEYGTVWAGDPGASERIGDVVHDQNDGETAKLYVDSDRLGA